MWGFLGHRPREYHIALSEALREAAVASVSEWLRLFSPAAGGRGDPNLKPRGWQRLGHPAQWVQSGSGWS